MVRITKDVSLLLVKLPHIGYADDNGFLGKNPNDEFLVYWEADVPFLIHRSEAQEKGLMAFPIEDLAMV